MRVKPDHDPYARPQGCNGKYGRSGARAHRYRGEQACQPCLTSETHYQREYRSGGIRKGRTLKPCGTQAAAKRHRVKGERLCFTCRVSEAAYWAEQRAKARKPCVKQPVNSKNSGTNSDSKGVTV